MKDIMSEENNTKDSAKLKVTIEDVNRVLEVGRLLFSVLTKDEIAELQRLLNCTSDGE